LTDDGELKECLRALCSTTAITKRLAAENSSRKNAKRQEECTAACTVHGHEAVLHAADRAEQCPEI